MWTMNKLDEKIADEIIDNVTGGHEVDCELSTDGNLDRFRCFVDDVGDFCIAYAPRNADREFALLIFSPGNKILSVDCTYLRVLDRIEPLIKRIVERV